MSGGIEQHRLEFSSKNSFHVFVRLLPQARQALLQAHSNTQPCSLQYNADGAPHVRFSLSLVLRQLMRHEDLTRCELSRSSELGRQSFLSRRRRRRRPVRLSSCLQKDSSHQLWSLGVSQKGHTSRYGAAVQAVRAAQASSPPGQAVGLDEPKHAAKP